jgi:hypothetical protein
MKWQSALCIGIIAALLFAGLSSHRLTGQGLYYDELHQATASFAYTGTPPLMFAPLTMHGIPLLNMTYTGAIKTAIYGIFLRYFGDQFSVMSWRLLGIVFVSTALLLFSFIVCQRLPFTWILFFLFFFLTDITVVLAARHDWGPVALGMLFRLLFVAVWIYGEIGKSTPLSNSFLLGSLVGISVFEKLSSIVLVLPLISIIAFSSRRRTLKHGLACVGGAFFGGMPLILVNLYSFHSYATFISLSEVAMPSHFSLSGGLQYISAYMSLGSGIVVKDFILGNGSNILSHVEGILLGTLLLLTAIIDVRYWKSSKFFQMSGIMMMSYLTIGIFLYIIPRPSWAHHTWANHWVIGTPFQYAAVSFALVGFWSAENLVILRRGLVRIIFSSVLILLMLLRVSGVVSIEKSFQRGDASMDWDPSLTDIGRFASSRANEAIFIAADWGVATQILCLSNGRPDLVFELFWNYQGLDQIGSIIKKTRKETIYVVKKKPGTDVSPQNTTRILRDVEKLRGWKEMAVEQEIAKLKALEIRKFSYMSKGME